MFIVANLLLLVTMCNHFSLLLTYSFCLKGHIFYIRFHILSSTIHYVMHN